MKNRITIILFVLVLGFIFTNKSNSQTNDDIWDKIEKIKLNKLLNKLKLDDNTTTEFSERYMTFSKTIRDLNKKRVLYLRLMSLSIKSGDGLDTLVDNVLNTEQEINQQRMDFAKDLKTMLTPKQIAIMIIFERRFNAELRKLLREFAEKRKNN